MSKHAFPRMSDGAKAVVSGDKITFSYLDSHSVAHTVTKPLLSVDDIIKLVMERADRFESAGPGVRESDESRFDRKYISAHPKTLLVKAFSKMPDMLKMEFSMMFDMNSHYGISDKAWAERHQERFAKVTGDDGNPL